MSVPPEEVVLSRRTIDEIDQALVELLARRRAVVQDLFAKKRALGLPLFDPVRETELLAARRARGVALGLAPDFVEVVFRAILDDSHALEDVR